MAKSHQSSVQDEMADVTECCICTDVFTKPKILPCIHTFCLRCLEKYGTEKKTGDQMTCQICRSEFFVPDGGFCNLPNNFFIDKMVEIRKLSEPSTIEALCGTCPDEDRMKAKMFCLQCEQNLCERCCVAHSKMKLCQNHQVVEIGNNLKPQEVNFRSSNCDQHPGEIVKMYCEDDKATICFLCFAESHQMHKCLSVTKASEEFSSSLRTDLKTVLERLPEFQTSLQKCNQRKKDFLAQIVHAERQIYDEAARLKILIDSHANILAHKLTALKDEKLKEIESNKEDVERFKVAIESFAKYSKELLSKGAPGDICREADQMKTRACHLVSVTKDSFSVNLKSDQVVFMSLHLEDVLCMKSIANVIGDVSLHEDCMWNYLTSTTTVNAGLTPFKVLKPIEKWHIRFGSRIASYVFFKYSFTC